MVQIIDNIEKHKGSDAEFGEIMTQWGQMFGKKLVKMLNSNFETHADATVFLKNNVDALLTVASEAKNAKLITMMGAPSIMKMLAKCKEEEVPVADKQEPKPQLAVAETLETKYARVLKANQDKLKAVIPQPLSNAYKTLNLEGSRALTMSETKIMENFD